MTCRKLINTTSCANFYVEPRDTALLVCHRGELLFTAAIRCQILLGKLLDFLYNLYVCYFN